MKLSEGGLREACVSMAVKQLDFNSPLPSVRRLGSALPPSPISYSYVVVPDRAVGLNSAKQECGMQRGVGESPRRSPLPFYKSDSPSGPIQKPGVVPFSWEQSPGQPKDGYVAGGTPTSPTDNLLQKEEESSANGLDSMTVRAFPCKSVPNSPHCSVRTPATLSRAESCFMHYSISGLSEDMESQASSRRISTDLQLPNITTGQFLPPPTAKATFSPELRSPVENKGQKQRSLSRSAVQKPPNPASENSWIRPQKEARNRENEDGDNEGDHKYDDLSQLWTKGCGILPRLCLKNSLCLMNLQSKKTKRPVSLPAAPKTESSWEELSLSGFKNLGQKGSRVSCDSNPPSFGSSSPIHGRKNRRSPAFCEPDFTLGKEKTTRLKRKQTSFSEASTIPEPVKFLSKFPSDSWISRSFPRAPSKEQTLRSLFEKSSIEATIKVPELSKSQMRFADVISCSIDPFFGVSSGKSKAIDGKLALRCRCWRGL